MQIPQKAVKPPSNYSNKSRQLSENRQARGLAVIQSQGLKRDKSLDVMQQPKEDMHNHETQQQLQAQLAMMQQQMQMIQIQQQRLMAGLPLQGPVTPQLLSSNPFQPITQGGNDHAVQSIYSHQLPSNKKLGPTEHHMSNTNYEVQPKETLIRLPGNNGDAQSVHSYNSKKTTSTNYKQYKLKDYQQMKDVYNNSKFGGLGANVGTEEWELAKRKKEIAL